MLGPCYSSGSRVCPNGHIHSHSYHIMIWVSRVGACYSQGLRGCPNGLMSSEKILAVDRRCVFLVNKKTCVLAEQVETNMRS